MTLRFTFDCVMTNLHNPTIVFSGLQSSSILLKITNLEQLSHLLVAYDRFVARHIFNTREASKDLAVIKIELPELMETPSW